MKTTQECWQALIDGEKLRHADHPDGRFVELSDGEVVDSEGRRWVFMFNFPEDWSIYTPPKWYDNIPEGGVLCRVWQSGYPLNHGIVTAFNEADGFFSLGINYECAMPLTKQEIQQLLDNAPEGEKE